MLSYTTETFTYLCT